MGQQDENNRKGLYEEVKKNIEKSLGCFEKTNIPEYWDAQRMWGM
jgi:hypothetical protein